MKKEKMIFVPAAFLMTAMLAFPAMASEKIEEVTIDINAVLTASDNLEVEAEVSDDGCYVDEVSVTNEPSGDWDDDTKPKVKITIGADSDYTFSTGLSKSDVYLGNDENRVTSVTRSSSKLYVYVTLQEISEIDTEYDDEDYELDAYDLTWDDSYGGVAYWEGTDYAKKYQVRLYRDGDMVGSTYTTTNNYYNFCGSFTKEGSYTFRVKAVRGSDESSWNLSRRMLTETGHPRSTQTGQQPPTTMEMGLQAPETERVPALPTRRTVHGFATASAGGGAIRIRHTRWRTGS